MQDNVLKDYSSCIGHIPLAIYVNIDDPDKLKEIIAKALNQEVTVKQLAEEIRDILSLKENPDLDMRLFGEKDLDEYASFLARAIIECKKYALRYEKCKKMEEDGASPDEIEVCYEMADKMRKPLFIYLW